MANDSPSKQDANDPYALDDHSHGSAARSGESRTATIFNQAQNACETNEPPLAASDFTVTNTPSDPGNAGCGRQKADCNIPNDPTACVDNAIQTSKDLGREQFATSDLAFCLNVC
ncbi:MAG: hypothetical protein P8R42_08565 [Candidatus Binatia bacterium]|nr:hypothetical protein [Candidatus Binatia bacterium]